MTLILFSKFKVAKIELLFIFLLNGLAMEKRGLMNFSINLKKLLLFFLKLIVLYFYPLTSNASTQRYRIY